MASLSAGLVVFRRTGRGGLEVLLVHPGGPFFRRRDEGAWSIPKGELAAGEAPLAAARRELEEETGLRPGGPFLELGAVRQRGGKEVRAWACESAAEPLAGGSNTFEIEWPPRSGRRRSFPEVDRAGYFPLAEARRKLNPAQVALLDELARRLKSPDGPAERSRGDDDPGL